MTDRNLAATMAVAYDVTWAGKGGASTSGGSCPSRAQRKADPALFLGAWRRPAHLQPAHKRCTVGVARLHRLQHHLAQEGEGGWSHVVGWAGAASCTGGQ